MPADAVMCARLVELLSCPSETPGPFARGAGFLPRPTPWLARWRANKKSVRVLSLLMLAAGSQGVRHVSLLEASFAALLPRWKTGAQRLCRVVSLYVALAEKLFDGPGACCTCFHLFLVFLPHFFACSLITLLCHC